MPADPLAARPWARFDDLVDGTAMLFPVAGRQIVAWRPEDVAPALAEVERLTAAGAWAFGFVAYEAAKGLDPVLRTHPPAPRLPLVWFGVAPVAAAVPVIDASPDSDRAAAGQPPAAGPGKPRGDAEAHERDGEPTAWACDWDAATHAGAVEAVRRAIAQGETYQVNLTTRLRGVVPTGHRQPAEGHPPGSTPRQAPSWYADLALAQRGRYNAYLDLGDTVIASGSPELFFELAGADGRDATMRPMKGTAARGRTTAEDALIVAALTASEKERAENLMIVDLVRNDLARVAEPASVRAADLCRAERYETVHQLTSSVTARLRPGVTLTDVFRALFPCGSITGAPKRRTMDLIADLENGPRGVYCGAIGVVAPPGAPFRARFSVAIRTIVADAATGAATYGVGGGITWSSRPADEYAELLVKAAVLARPAHDVHLIETMRHEAGRGVRLLDRHLARLGDSAAYLGFRWDEEAARRAVAHATAAARNARVRLLAFRSGKLRAEVGPLPAPDAAPLRLAIDDDPIDSRDWRWQHKTSWREPYERRRAAHPDADEVLLVNEHGEVTEACTANVVVRLGGGWVTPPTTSGCLPGVQRAALIAAGSLQERRLTVADVRAAAEIALINALRGWRPATLLPP